MDQVQEQEGIHGGLEGKRNRAAFIAGKDGLNFEQDSLARARGKKSSCLPPGFQKKIPLAQFNVLKSGVFRGKN